MKKQYLKLFVVLVLCLLFLTGCDEASVIVDWLNGLFSGYIATIGCWLLQMVVALSNASGYLVNIIVSPLIALLPEVTLPTISLSDSEFLQYAAYFLPISEAATLFKALILFYSSFFVGKLVLRWLKVIK